MAEPSALFPPVEPYCKGYLAVSHLHTLYYEECGNPEGLVMLFLHGGPGGGCGETSRRFFNPAHWRTVLFDQRGAGRSRPCAELRENTTWDLVADIERLREHLRIGKWVLFGGSWGSTLALAYATQHPERVAGMILRGVVMGQAWEDEWLFAEGGGASILYPDAWEAFIAPLPEPDRGDIKGGYYRLLTSANKAVRLVAAQAWSRWEAATCKLVPDAGKIEELSQPENAVALARLECHYFLNGCFLPHPDYLVERLDTLRDLPVSIIQGRYDVICPPLSAWRLHRALPRSELELVPTAGHSALDPDLTAALVRATEGFRERGHGS